MTGLRGWALSFDKSRWASSSSSSSPTTLLQDSRNLDYNIACSFFFFFFRGVVGEGRGCGILTKGKRKWIKAKFKGITCCHPWLCTNPTQAVEHLPASQKCEVRLCSEREREREGRRGGGARSKCVICSIQWPIYRNSKFSRIHLQKECLLERS